MAGHVPIQRGIGVRDEGVEAVLVPLRMPSRDDGVAGGPRVLAGAAQKLPVHSTAADPQRLGVLLVEAEGLGRPVDGEPQPVLPHPG